MSQPFIPYRSPHSTGAAEDYRYRVPGGFVMRCFTPVTAFLQINYPTGRYRCLRRLWAEKGLHGKVKGWWRLATQTTVDSFNSTYTHKLDQKRERPLPMRLRDVWESWLAAEVREKMWQNEDLWNAPQYTTYSPFMAWQRTLCYHVVPSPTVEPGFISYTQFTVERICKPADFQPLFDWLRTEANNGWQWLRPDQLAALDRAEQYGRRANETDPQNPWVHHPGYDWSPFISHTPQPELPHVPEPDFNA